jgi:pimeloyl-ACP methyl ester carboxylesterase
VLAIQSTADEYGTEKQVEAIMQGVSGRAESLMIPRVHHNPHREAPDLVIDATDRFLRHLLML